MALSYPEAIDFLYALQRHGIKLGLETISGLLSNIGNPQRQYGTLHIGGTNGKGSTAAITASMLEAAGYRVGLYTSPHLIDFCERVRVNGEPIPPRRVSDLTERLRATAAVNLHPTFFEFTTAMAFQYFAEEGVDVAIIEVGMGGRFDATNILNPWGVLITTVALDHEEYLGSTLASIAYEKAGIIKHDVPAVVGRVPTEAEQVIVNCAAAQGAVCHRLRTNFHVHRQSPEDFHYVGLSRSYDHLSCSLPGDHQFENAACALALLEVCEARGLRVPERAIRSALQSVVWEGRLETIEHEPLLLLDGAHNPAAANVLASYLVRQAQRRPGGRIILVIGMMRDKDHAGFHHIMAPLADEIILTQASLPRAATVEQLESSLPINRGSVHLVPHPKEALALARKLATSKDLICVTGSLILVGEIKSLLGDHECSLLGR